MTPNIFNMTGKPCTRSRDFGSWADLVPDPDPAPFLCAISGRPAKYRDPKTLLPFATSSAQKTLHKQYRDAEMSAIYEMGEYVEAYDEWAETDERADVQVDNEELALPDPPGDVAMAEPSPPGPFVSAETVAAEPVAVVADSAPGLTTTAEGVTTRRGARRASISAMDQ